MIYTPPFQEKIITLYGDEGRTWLDELPRLTQHIQDEWALSKLEPLPNLNFHYVLSGVGQGQSIVLKMGLDKKGLSREAKALKSFESFGGIKLLQEQEGALLLERALPGESLKEAFDLDDPEAIEITCRIMRKLHQAPLPEKGTFSTLKERLLILDRYWEIPVSTLKRAREIRDYLLDTCTAPVLLHGDLHHENIIRSKSHEEGWVAIDPKGLIGEACYDVPAFIRNPIPDLMLLPEIAYVLRERIEIFAELMELDPYRIISWSFVQAVLAWAWSLDDLTDPSYYKHLVPFLEDML